MPFFPLGVGTLAKTGGLLSTVAKRHRATQAQVALAWLLARSSVILPIPGTSRPDHLEENWSARSLRLTEDEVHSIAAAARK